MAATWPRSVDDFEGRPRVRVVSAGVAVPAKHKAGDSSVFARQLVNPKTSAPDPASLEDIEGPPPERTHGVPSAWRAVYKAISTTKGKKMTQAQAIAFASWARQNKLKIKRQRISGDVYGVWRAQPTQATAASARPTEKARA